jgi:hypothetical protein
MLVAIGKGGIDPATNPSPGPPEVQLGMSSRGTLGRIEGLLFHILTFWIANLYFQS